MLHWGVAPVPAFVTENGDNIYESNAIAYYVSSSALRGTSDLDAALVQQYLCFAENELLPPICTWVFPTFGYMPFNKETARVAQEAVKRLLGVLNDVLATRTFLVGERVTLADIGVCCTLLMLYKQVLEPQSRNSFVNLNRWFVTCINQPQFKKVLGDVTLCEKAAQFDAKKYAELHPKKEKPAKEKQPQQEKKQQEKKKQEKKPKEPEPEEEEEEEAPKHVFVDPYLSLPKSSFVLDAFKRTFCNEDPVKNTIPYLWENFDKEGYSIWRCDYLYPEELKMTFMASNLVGGFFQRIEKLHKYGFAVIYVLGENYKLNISGFWILRGQELAFD
uniref:Elongation factor 1-gamma n=1 Tax=Amphimedon queenslandica TaxID=400682 RepID=A0A1X7SSY8_AMPQE